MDETRAIWRRDTFEYGRSDCLMAAADHVLRVTGKDPAAPWRGAYHDKAGADALMAAHGGALGLMGEGLEIIGIAPGEACVGAAVVCDVRGEQVAGICTGLRVMFMAEGRGMAEMRAPILRAWPL